MVGGWWVVVVDLAAAAVTHDRGREGGREGGREEQGGLGCLLDLELCVSIHVQLEGAVDVRLEGRGDDDV